MAIQSTVTAPELEQFLVFNVETTGLILGAGAYGSVEEVEIPGARIAAKKLHPQLINLGSHQQVRKWVTDFVEECKLMSQLRHPHIVQFLGVCHLPGSQLPVLLMEKLLTSLDNLLETKPDIPLDVKVHLLTGIARGVVYLHSHTPPIAHRDLTARNILIDSGLIAKIADLGVAKMVNIQPGQLAATMTAGPGNHLYMPPEAVNEEEATRYNTSIDIFSFGVVSLFTLTQTFPKDLKPHNYRDPQTRKLIARSEIERREDYIQLMQRALGETHPLVKLNLDCLEYNPEERPSAVEVLRQLEEVGKTLHYNCTDTKLKQMELISRKSGEIQHIQEEHQRQLLNKDAQIHLLQDSISELQEANDCLKADLNLKQSTIDLQQEQLEVQRREIEHLSSQQKSQELLPQEEGAQKSQKSRQIPIPAISRKTAPPHSKSPPRLRTHSAPKTVSPAPSTPEARQSTVSSVSQTVKSKTLPAVRSSCKKGVKNNGISFPRRSAPPPPVGASPKQDSKGNEYTPPPFLPREAPLPPLPPRSTPRVKKKKHRYLTAPTQMEGDTNDPKTGSEEEEATEDTGIYEPVGPLEQNSDDEPEESHREDMSLQLSGNPNIDRTSVGFEDDRPEDVYIEMDANVYIQPPKKYKPKKDRTSKMAGK